MKVLKNVGDVLTPVRLQLMVGQDDPTFPYGGWGKALSHAYYGEHLTNWDQIVLGRLHLRLFSSWDDVIRFVYDSCYADGHIYCEMSPVDEMRKYLNWMYDNKYDSAEAVRYFTGYAEDSTNPYTADYANHCLRDVMKLEEGCFDPFSLIF